MAHRYVAGAAGLPFAVLRGYRGTGLAARTPTVATVTCPFTGEELAAVAAVNPDVAVIHAQQADRAGNVRKRPPHPRRAERRHRRLNPLAQQPGRRPGKRSPSSKKPIN